MYDMTDMRDITLTLFMSAGMSLQAWDDNGILDRELAIYQRLLGNIGNVQFFTYGPGTEREFEKRYDSIRTLPWIIPRYRKIHEYTGMLSHYANLKGSDIFKTNQIKGSGAALRAKRLFGKPLIVRCGYIWSRFEEMNDSPREEIAKALKAETMAFNMADACVLACEPDREYIIKRHGISKSKTRVIPNYVDTALFTPADISPKPGSVLFVGRLDEQKNILNLMIGAEKSQLTTKLTIAGDGPLRGKLESMARDMKTDVVFLGRVKHERLPTLINMHAVFALPSHYEGSPKALLEAMSSKAPCLGGDSEGINNVIEHGKTGWISDTSAEGIGQSLDALHGDPTLRLTMGANARDKIIDQYSLDSVTGMELDLIRELLAGNPRKDEVRSAA